VDVRVLGCSGGWPGPGRPCSGYLLSEGATRVWVDAGAGTLAELLRHGALAELDALWISHLHPDHCSDLGLVRNALAYGPERGARRLPVLGPPGWRAWFDGAVPDPDATSAVFEMRELVEGEAEVFGSIRLRPFPVSHGVPTFGCRAESDAGVWAYSADSGPCAALVELAARADLFLCEAFRSAPEAGELATVMTPEQAGAAAAASGARRLVLTHLHPSADPEGAADRARATYAGPVEVAAPGAVYRVGATG
jgi:ribonuclease BN (tRNA processing enzyme)